MALRKFRARVVAMACQQAIDVLREAGRQEDRTRIDRIEALQALATARHAYSGEMDLSAEDYALLGEHWAAVKD